jgi:tetratricopeptide (TPR) repeat protein
VDFFFDREDVSMQTRVGAFLCSALLFVPLFVQADSGSSSDNLREKKPEATSDYDAGYKHLKAGEYTAAIQAFKRAIKSNPNHAMAYNNMAYSYRKLGKYDEAIPLYEKALKIDPNLAEAHEYMGEALLAVGRVEDAKKHLAILEKLDPKLADELRAEIARRQRS